MTLGVDGPRAVAIVLAAGAGTRLGGACKATLCLPDGRTFVAAIVAAARAAGCVGTRVVVGGAHEAAARAAARGAGVTAAEVVPNEDPARGMASSIACALATLDPAAVDAALIWPVDQPLVGAHTVVRVRSTASRGGIVVPTWRGRGGHPAAFGVDVWPELRAAAAAPGGARAVVAADPARVVRLAVDDPGVGIDVDTPADVERVRRGV